MSGGGNTELEVEEYYFDDYYRVIVIRSSQYYVVSVDVYVNHWIFDVYESTCIEDTCLLVKKLGEDALECISGVREIMVVGVKVGSKLETINVKWFVDHRPSAQEVETIYRCSWKLITSYNQPKK